MDVRKRRNYKPWYITSHTRKQKKRDNMVLTQSAARFTVYPTCKHPAEGGEKPSSEGRVSVSSSWEHPGVYLLCSFSGRCGPDRPGRERQPFARRMMRRAQMNTE